jgi:hypothetical protein
MNPEPNDQASAECRSICLFQDDLTGVKRISQRGCAQSLIVPRQSRRRLADSTLNIDE